jgi:hypothetical protein
MEWDGATVASVDGPSDEQIASAGAELSTMLDGSPELPAQFQTHLLRRLPPRPDEESWELLRSELSATLGDGPGGLVMWSCFIDASSEDRERRLQRLRAHADAEVVEFVTTVRLAFATDFHAAWVVYGEIPNNWRTVNREIYIDVTRGRPFIKLMLTKFNGEKVVVEGTGDSILNLVAYLSAALTTLGDASLFSNDIIDYHKENAGALLAMLQSAEESRRDEQELAELPG